MRLFADRPGERGVSLADGFDRAAPGGLLRQSAFPITRPCGQCHRRSRRMADGSLFVSRYADVEFVYKHPKIFSSDKKREFGEKFDCDSAVRASTRRVWCSTILHCTAGAEARRRLADAARVAQIEPDLEDWWIR